MRGLRRMCSTSTSRPVTNTAPDSSTTSRSFTWLAATAAAHQEAQG